MKRFSLFILSGFYILAGINHFINPGFYLPLIPDYLPYNEVINVFSGLAEIALGAGLLVTQTRRLSAKGIVLLLVLFIPSHVYFIQQGHCVGDLCVSPWVGWVRLIVIHPLLILWAYWHSKK
ncbi:hypothetical protein [Marinoscillum sp.]|uniref:DoxX family protein n=1 Tax=Marinoscillum sp. TaxID=2024838 RepID=UPI003BAC6308